MKHTIILTFLILMILLNNLHISAEVYEPSDEDKINLIKKFFPDEGNKIIELRKKLIPARELWLKAAEDQNNPSPDLNWQAKKAHHSAQIDCKNFYISFKKKYSKLSKEIYAKQREIQQEYKDYLKDMSLTAEQRDLIKKERKEKLSNHYETVNEINLLQDYAYELTYGIIGFKKDKGEWINGKLVFNKKTKTLPKLPNTRATPEIFKEMREMGLVQCSDTDMKNIMNYDPNTIYKHKFIRNTVASIFSLFFYIILYMILSFFIYLFYKKRKTVHFNKLWKPYYKISIITFSFIYLSNIYQFIPAFEKHSEQILKITSKSDFIIVIISIFFVFRTFKRNLKDRV